MEWLKLETWLNFAPLWLIALVLFGFMWLAAYLAARARQRQDRIKAEGKEEAEPESNEGYIVSAVLGLLALLLGFTFSLAVDRFDTRRAMVLEEANAIGTAYFRTQLLPEPHRSRTAGLLVRYLDNRIVLAKAAPGPEQARLLVVNDGLITDVEAAAAAGFDTIRGIDFSSSFLDSINRVTELEAARKIVRIARVPSAVFGVLFLYMITSAFVLGYVLRARLGRLAAGFLLLLFTIALMLIIDIDRPTGGQIDESQIPMELLRSRLAKQPPAIFDRWRTPVDAAAVK